MTAPPTLSIGAVLGDYDSEHKAWLEAIDLVGSRTMRLSDGVESPLRVNVVFYTAGKYNTNPFVGVRTGCFSKKDSHLMIQAAVPPGAG